MNKFLTLFTLIFILSFSASAEQSQPLAVAPQKDAAIKPMSYYSNYEVSIGDPEGGSEHGGGANLWLWKDGSGKVVGLFCIYEGTFEHEYGGVSPINDFSLNHQTNEVAFSFLENYGNAKKLNYFNGKISNSTLKGYATGASYSKAVEFEMELIPATSPAFRKHLFFKPFASLKEWAENTPPKKTKF